MLMSKCMLRAEGGNCGTVLSGWLDKDMVLPQYEFTSTYSSLVSRFSYVYWWQPPHAASALHLSRLKHARCKWNINTEKCMQTCEINKKTHTNKAFQEALIMSIIKQNVLINLSALLLHITYDTNTWLMVALLWHIEQVKKQILYAVFPQ